MYAISLEVVRMGAERRFASLLRICDPVDDEDCWEGYSWRSGDVVIFLICVFGFYLMGQKIRTSVAKRRSAPIRTLNPTPPQIQKTKKIRTHPHLPGTRGKAPSRIRVSKKSKPIQKLNRPPKKSIVQ